MGRTGAKARSEVKIFNGQPEAALLILFVLRLNAR
jgi:hypothetical protein